MRTHFLYILLFLPYANLSAQNILESQGNTYALVVGISNYEDERIADLNFAHRDAQIFADYLKSKAGGSVPDENINLLVNSSATNAAIYNGLYQLKVKAQSGDKVIIYFSGHGDVETDEFNPLGFLLAHDTPFNNYRNNALRVSDLNLDASTIIKKKNAKIVFLIDACHSAQLSGTNNNGSMKVAMALEENADDQVRIMSCKPI